MAIDFNPLPFIAVALTGLICSIAIHIIDTVTEPGYVSKRRKRELVKLNNVPPTVNQ